MMNLAQRITDTSLKLYLPITQREGRAHRYESIFRTGVEAIKSNASAEDEELKARVAGNILKRLDRISGGACPTYGDTRVKVVQEFAELLVMDLFNQVCGRSVSKLTHQENPIADAIYFLTAQQINTRWDEHKKQHPKKVASTTATDDAEIDESEA